ncbi:uncharacterized protein [Mobula birostris]|uniref:uncharacterized protein n=1 Tax=Mobula birostris TaxID=1983395 RepID=UPI003B287060
MGQVATTVTVQNGLRETSGGRATPNSHGEAQAMTTVTTGQDGDAPTFLPAHPSPAYMTSGKEGSVAPQTKGRASSIPVVSQIVCPCPGEDTFYAEKETVHTSEFTTTCSPTRTTSRGPNWASCPPSRSPSAWKDHGYLMTAKGCTETLYTSQGYFFFYNGTATNFLEYPDPSSVAYGTFFPSAVPCPGAWGPLAPPPARLKREDPQEFCVDYRKLTTLTPGQMAGYGAAGFFSLGASGAVMAAHNRSYLACGLTSLGNATRGALKLITDSLSQLRLFSMQNRYALDYLLVREGGICVIVKDQCIMGLDDATANIARYVNQVDEQLGSIKEGTDWGGWGNWGLGAWKDWLINGAIYALTAIIGIFVCIAVVKCVLNRMMASLEDLMPAKPMMVVKNPVEAGELLEPIPEDLET